MRPRNEPREVVWRMGKRMPNGCREWQGGKDGGGYGRVSINGRSRAAHQVAYEVTRGPIPEGLMLDHYVCDNPSCIDPWHLEPATNRENSLRAEKGVSAIDDMLAIHGHPEYDSEMVWHD